MRYAIIPFGLYIALFTLQLDVHRVPVSSNPVWNACVREQGLSFDLIQNNTDRFEHRSRSLRVFRPWSCRDYHRGPRGRWIMPELENAELLLGKDGKFLGVLDTSPLLRIIVPEVDPTLSGSP